MTPHLEITTRIGCRVSCLCCPQDPLLKAYLSQGRPVELTLERFKACIDKVPTEVTIHFSGFAEPFLNSSCAAMMRYACEKGHPVDVFSTLDGATLSDLGAIEHIPFQRFIVHLPSVEIRERLDIGELYFCKLDFVRTRIRSAAFVYLGETLRPQVQARLKGGEDLRRYSPNTRANNIRIKGQEMTGRKSGALMCERGLGPNVMLPDGDVVLCCMDYGPKHKIGNLLVDRYEDLAQSQEFQRIRRGCEDENEDILCRYCARFAYNRH